MIGLQNGKALTHMHEVPKNLFYIPELQVNNQDMKTAKDHTTPSTHKGWH
jgi:hypothetical protein